MESKQILFLTNWYPTRENPSFGVFVKRHAECLAENYNITVVHLLFEKGFFPLKITAEISDINQSTIVLRFSGILFKFLYYMPGFISGVIERKLKVFKPETKFDLIVSNVLFNARMVGYFLSKKMNIKQLHIEHWSGIEKFIRGNFIRKSGLKALNNSSEIIVVSNQLKETIKSLNVIPDISVVPNVISSYFKYNEVSKSIEKLNFLAVANWKYPKRLDLLIDSLNLLKQRNTSIDFKLTLIGNGPLLASEIMDQINFQMDRFPAIDNLKLPDFYNEADLLLHFSDFETFSIVPLEAMACGCPVITSRVGVLPDYINNTNGKIVKNNVLEIVASIENSIKTRFSRLDISNQVVNQFSKETVAQIFEEILDRNF